MKAISPLGAGIAHALSAGSLSDFLVDLIDMFCAKSGCERKIAAKTNARVIVLTALDKIPIRLERFVVEFVIDFIMKFIINGVTLGLRRMFQRSVIDIF